MPAAIEIFFEFPSPYSYLAAQALPGLAERHGRALRWRPIEIGKVWAAQGVFDAYMAVRKVKARHIMHDAQRVAAALGVPLVPFRTFPDVTLARLAVHRLNRCAPEAVTGFVQGAWRRLFVEGEDIGSLEGLVRGLDPSLHEAVAAAADDPQAAADLAAANAEAIASRCFGVPWIVADGETYFGQDRLYLLERALEMNP